MPLGSHDFLLKRVTVLVSALAPGAATVARTKAEDPEVEEGFRRGLDNDQCRYVRKQEPNIDFTHG